MKVYPTCMKANVSFPKRSFFVQQNSREEIRAKSLLVSMNQNLSLLQTTSQIDEKKDGYDYDIYIYLGLMTD